MIAAPSRSNIQHKLMVAIMTTSGAVVMLTCAAFIAWEVVTFRKDMLGDMTTRARIIAANATAALAFSNSDDATEVLSAFRDDPRMVAAALYDERGRLFAKYPADAPDGRFPAEPERDSSRMGDGRCVVFHPVSQGDLWLGTVFLESDLSAMTERFRLYSIVSFVVLASAALMAFLLSRRIRSRIAAPILELSRAARDVTETKDYAIRAARSTDDEVGMLTDSFNAMLTEIQDRDASLREGEARMRAILESALDCIITFDEAGRIVEFNRAAEATFGRPRADAIGRHLGEFLALPPPDSGESRRGDPLSPDFVPFLGKRVEATGIDSEGVRFAVECALTPIDRAGAPLYTGIVRDITERKLSEAAIRRLASELESRVIERTEQLETSNRELEAFSYSVSHDLRAPLRSIDGFSRAVLDDESNRLSDAGTKALARVRAATQRMGDLIDDLLKLSRISRADLQPTGVNLTVLAREVAGELRSAEPERDVSFAIQDDLTVTGDSQLLGIVVDNLVRNSWKYTSKHPRAKIEVGAERTNGSAKYFVRDDGAGFDMAHAGLLFSPFQRLHRQSDFEGTGVGLATVQRIIRRHGGRVWAEGTVEGGATFYFTLWEGANHG